jgi:hypothetical protein
VDNVTRMTEFPARAGQSVLGPDFNNVSAKQNAPPLKKEEMGRQVEQPSPEVCSQIG